MLVLKASMSLLRRLMVKRDGSGKGKTTRKSRRRDVRPLHVDVDPTPTTIEQRSSDFRTVGGVRFAFASTETDLQSGQILETTTVRSVKVNPPLIPVIFERL